MIRVAEYVARTDTGHQRSTNEDAHLARAPVFVIADGMGGAQAGEVASQLAITHFAQGLPGEDGDSPQERLTRAVQEANAEIHALSERDARRAGMGTTLTAAYVGAGEVSFAHVGDSRGYLLRDGELARVTEDHSLVEELLRQGRLTEEEAEEHPQRSIITRALGPEPDVEVDTVTLTAAAGDVYLICSDGLTSMVSEATVAEIMREADGITAAADRLVAAALDAGGRDNVTVVLFRLEDVAGAEDEPGEDAAPVNAARTAELTGEPAAAPHAAPTAELAGPPETPPGDAVAQAGVAPAAEAAIAPVAPIAPAGGPAPASPIAAGPPAEARPGLAAARPPSRSPHAAHPHRSPARAAAKAGDAQRRRARCGGSARARRGARRAGRLLHRHQRLRPGDGVQRHPVHASGRRAPVHAVLRLRRHRG